MPPEHFQRAAEAMARAIVGPDHQDDIVWWHPNGAGEPAEPYGPRWTTEIDTAKRALHALLAILPEIGWRLVPTTLSLEKDVRPLERVIIDQVHAEKGELYIEDCGIDTIYRDMIAAAPSFSGGGDGG